MEASGWPSDESSTSTTSEETTEYTIKSVNTGLVGDHVNEVVTVKDGKGKPTDYREGDTVSLTETQYESLKEAGVKFEEVK